MKSKSRESLGDGGNVLEPGYALRRADRQRAQIAALHERRGGRHRQYDELSPAGERVLYPDRHDGVRDLQDPGPGERVQPGGDHAGEVSRAVGGERELAGLRLVERDQLGQRARRNAGVREQDEGNLRDHADWGEIPDRVVGQGLERVGVAHQRRRGGAEEVVAVGRGASRRLRADDVAGAGAVVHDDLLAQCARQAPGDEAADDVGRAARRLRDDDPDRSRGPGLGGHGRAGHVDTAISKSEPTKWFMGVFVRILFAPDHSSLTARRCRQAAIRARRSSAGTCAAARRRRARR